eukprot:243287-Chlamydomonas_euryale.AAC.1
MVVNGCVDKFGWGGARWNGGAGLWPGAEGERTNRGQEGGQAEGGWPGRLPAHRSLRGALASVSCVWAEALREQLRAASASSGWFAAKAKQLAC